MGRIMHRVETPPRRPVRTVVSVLASVRRRGPIRLEHSLLVVNVIGRASVDLSEAVSETGAPVKVRVINVFGVVDVKLPRALKADVMRISLGPTRLSRPVALPS